MDLNAQELNRYGRHLAMHEFGIEEQLKLKNASVLVIGAGGLGSPILLYLAAAGVGTIGIVEFDTIDLSNLQRQVLYDSDDIGKSKIEVAQQKLQKINPNVQINIHEEALTSSNARSIIAAYDVVVDGTDNFPTRYLVNDACVLENKPNVYGSVLRFEGQVCVFNLLRKDGSRGPNYRDLYPVPPPPGLVPNCAEAGVLGVLPGIIGSMQASEVIKVLTNLGDPLDGRLWIFDALSFTSRILNFKRTDQVITGLIDYEAFCGLKYDQENDLTPKQAFELINSNSTIKVLDVREIEEYTMDNIGGRNLPLSVLRDRLNEIDSNESFIVMCQSGKRSLTAISIIAAFAPETQLYNLKGGLNQWRKDLGEENLSD